MFEGNNPLKEINDDKQENKKEKNVCLFLKIKMQTNNLTPNDHLTWTIPSIYNFYQNFELPWLPGLAASDRMNYLQLFHYQRSVTKDGKLFIRT